MSFPPLNIIFEGGGIFSKFAFLGRNFPLKQLDLSEDSLQRRTITVQQLVISHRHTDNQTDNNTSCFLQKNKEICLFIFCFCFLEPNRARKWSNEDDNPQNWRRSQLYMQSWLQPCGQRSGMYFSFNHEFSRYLLGCFVF